jgi:hypothetical protein
MNVLRRLLIPSSYFLKSTFSAYYIIRERAQLLKKLQSLLYFCICQTQRIGKVSKLPMEVPSSLKKLRVYHKNLSKCIVLFDVIRAENACHALGLLSSNVLLPPKIARIASCAFCKAVFCSFAVETAPARSAVSNPENPDCRRYIIPVCLSSNWQTTPNNRQLTEILTRIYPINSSYCLYKSVIFHRFINV